MGEGRAGLAQTPMQSPVNWALLGLVIERPGYAYELAQRFDRTYDGAIALSSTSHVYTVLAALEKRGLIEEVPGSGTGSRQPKPRYRATEIAAGLYKDWLVRQFAEEHRRQRLFALELAALMSGPELARKVIDEYEQACLAEAGNQRPNADNGAATSTSQLAELLADELSRVDVGARLEWLQYARAQLQARLQRRQPVR